MKKKNLLSRLKATVICGAVTASALVVPMTVGQLSTVSAAGSDNYAKLLQHSLYFYDANMCGTGVDSKCGITWRGNCHTDDEVPGGFHDAGDHAVFGLPQGYAASTLGWSYYEFKDAFEATGQADHLKMITDYFCDFFKRSTKLNGDSVSSFLYQKGNGDEDHGYWGAPEKQPGGRKMYWTSNGASDIAAEYAAALAANYVNFGNSEDLKYAEALYKFSTQYNQIATDGPYGFYNNSSCKDEQAWAAGWLYLATKKDSYKNDCGSKYNQYLGWVHGWESVDLGAACLYSEITNDWSKVGGYISGKCQGSNYFCLDDWGSARYNCSLQFTALIASKHSSADLGNWCKGQMDYILGNNPFNVCFVTGLESNSAKNTHHRAASGYQGYNPPDGMNEHTTTYHPTNGKVLIGALAGGPTAGGQYSDVMNDYKCNEVALDYNAGLVGAAAGLYSKYKTGSTSSSITGVDKIYSGGSTPNPPTTEPPTQPPVTTTTTAWNQWQPETTTTTTAWNPWQPETTTTAWNQWQPETTTTTTAWNPWNPWQPETTTTTVQQGGDDSKTVNPGASLDFNDEVKKIYQINISDVLPANAKANKFIVKLSGNGDLNGSVFGCGLSVTNTADNWQDIDGNLNVSGNSATYTCDVRSIQNYIQPDGKFQIGYWWGNQSQVRVDSITCEYTITAASEPATTTTTTAAAPTPTQPTTSSTHDFTQAPPDYTTTYQYATPTTTTSTNNGQSTTPPQGYIPEGTMYGDINLNGEIDIADVVMLNLYILDPNANPLGETQDEINRAIANADCVRDHQITSADSTLILNYVAMLITDRSQLGRA